MVKLRKTIEISASPETVWEVLADLEQWSDWTPSITSVELLDGGSPEMGKSAKILQPKLPPAVWTITSWTPVKSFVWESRRLGVVTRAEHVITPKDQGCTVDLGIEFGGLLGGVVGRLASKLTTEYMGLEAEGLKRRCERNQA